LSLSIFPAIESITQYIALLAVLWDILQVRILWTNSWLWFGFFFPETQYGDKRRNPPCTWNAAECWI